MWRRLEDLLNVLAHVCSKKINLRLVLLHQRNACRLGHSMRTKLFEHLVTLIQDEMFHTLGHEVLLTNQLQHTARRANNNVRRLVIEDTLVLRDRHASVKHLALHIRQVSRKPLELVGNLVGELTGMTENDCTDGILLCLQLMHGRKHENSSLTHSGLSLAEHVHTKDGLRDALVLHLGRMLEAAVNNGTKKLGLEQEITETRCMYARVGAAPRLVRTGGQMFRHERPRPRPFGVKRVDHSRGCERCSMLDLVVLRRVTTFASQGPLPLPHFI